VEVETQARMRWIVWEGGMGAAITCFMAVRKPCPLLKPGNQYDLGRPCRRQSGWEREWREETKGHG
jgi:hypothetical protein